MTFYLDTSALLKRYVEETGSTWLSTLYEPTAGHVLATALITKAEAIAAVAARYRQGDVPETAFDAIEQDIAWDFVHTYSIVEITEPLIELAATFAKRQKLRGYDAVQLAAGVTLNEILLQAQLAPVTFVSADHNLLLAARNEGLDVENPNSHS